MSKIYKKRISAYALRMTLQYMFRSPFFVSWPSVMWARYVVAFRLWLVLRPRQGTARASFGFPPYIFLVLFFLLFGF